MLHLLIELDPQEFDNIMGICILILSLAATSSLGGFGMSTVWKTVKSQKGITWLETAILLITFVVVSSVFAFAAVSTGLSKSNQAAPAEIADGNIDSENTDTTLNVCMGDMVASGVDEIGNISQSEAQQIQKGDNLIIVASGGADEDQSRVEVADMAGTLDACDGNGQTGMVVVASGPVVWDIDDNRIGFWK